MVNVLVIGATGYIGQALTQSLIRSGNHQVYGLARTAEKAQSITKDEVIPILGSITDNSELIRAIDAFHINVVVDAAGANHESHTLLELLKVIGKSRLSTHTSKLAFIYTSGTYVHGSSNDLVNDLTPVEQDNSPTPPAKIVAGWRPKLEQDILASSEVLDVMIIRPALVFGRSNTIWTSLLQPIYSAAQSGSPSVSVPVEPDSRPGLVHVDDVGSGLHCAVDKIAQISSTGVYPVFDLATSQESMRDILEAAAKQFKVKGPVKLAGAGDDVFLQALSSSQNICTGRAKTILGWEPKKYGLVSQMHIQAQAWAANKQH